MLINKKHKNFIKGITLILILTFTFNFVFPTNLVYAASQNKQAGTNQGGYTGKAKNQINTKLGSLSQELNSHYQKLKDNAAKKDITEMRESIKSIKQALANSKNEISEEFDNNEKILKRIGADSAISRNREFRNQFQKKSTELETIIKELDSISNNVDIFNELDASDLTEKLQKMQKLMSPEEEHNPLGSELPHRNVQIQPAQPAIGGGIAPAYASADTQVTGSSLPWQPTPEDLAETRETRFTPDIVELADTLSDSPLEIYESVRNNILFEPYYGSRKGATGTLREKSGNDFDQASLLIALLRYKKIPARYIRGTVEIPINKVMKWTGSETPAAAVQTLGSLGIPVSSRVAQGGIASVYLEHIWVEAYVPYENYRGIGPKTGEKIWVPLDPSFKQHSRKQGLNLEEIAGVDKQSIINSLQNNGEVSTDGLTVTKVDFNLLNSRLDGATAKIKTYVKENDLEQGNIKDIIGGLVIVPEFTSVLPLTLPYQTIQVVQKFDAVPDNLTDWVGFSIQGAGLFGLILSGEDEFVYKSSAPELYGKKITLSWAPASSEDENIIKEYGGLFNTPAYLVQVKAELKIDGQVMGSGSPVGLGYKQNFTITMGSAGVTEEKVVNPVKAGAFYAVGLDFQKVESAELLKIANKIKQIQPSVTEQNIYTDEVLGEILNGAAKAYFGQVDLTNEFLAEKYGIRATRLISEAMTGLDVVGTYLFYAPVEISPGGMFIDVDRDVVSTVSQNGQRQDERAYMVASGIQASAMEHVIWEELLDVPAVSTIKVLNEANQRGIPIYTVTKENIDRVLPELEVSQTVKIDITNAVNSGRIVTVPKQNITYYNWNGTGYLIMDPESGSAAYMISGGTAGGMAAIAVAMATLVSLVIGTYLFIDALALLVATSLVSQLLGLVLAVSAEYYLIDTLVQAYRYYVGGDPSSGEHLITSAIIGAAFTGGFKAAGFLINAVKNFLGKEIGVLTFNSWQASEAYLLKNIGGETHVFFRTSDGVARYVDVLDPSRIAHEAKVGYTPLTDFVKKQVEKDAILMQEKQINGAVWHFYRSTQTGEIGPSEPLRSFLQEKGIKYFIYD